MIAQERAKSGKSAVAVRKKLKGAARDLGKKGKDKIFGYGLVISKPNCERRRTLDYLTIT